MKAQNMMQIDFLSKSSNEGFARVAVAGFAAQLDPTLEEIGDIKTAVSEAVTNAIVHAYPDKIGKIRIKAKLYENSILELVIRDWGVGIENIEQAREPHVYHRRRRTQWYGIYHHGKLHGCAESKIDTRKGDDRYYEAEDCSAWR